METLTLKQFEERGYQTQAWKDMGNFTRQWIRNTLENPKKIDLWTSMPINMATGSGKTFTVGDYLRKLYLSRNKLEKINGEKIPIRMLVLNDRINQVNQLEKDLIEGRDGKPPLLGKDIKEHAVIKLFHSKGDSTGNIAVKNEVKKSGHGKDKVYFSTFGSTVRFAAENPIWDIILVDEGHHLLGETYREALMKEIKRSEKATGRTPLVIPMTATIDPIRHLVNDPVVNFGLAEYIASPYSPAIEYNLVTSSDFTTEKLEEVHQEIKRIGKLTDIREKRKQIEEMRTYIEEHLAKFGGLSDLVADIIERLDSLDHTIIFASSIDEVDKITAEINRQTGDKNTAVALHSKIDEADQDVLDDYRDGKKKVIVAVDKLNEGIDLPLTKNVVFWRDVKSPTVFQQQFGRGLRGDKVRYYDYTGVLRNMAWLNGINQEIRDLPKNPKGEPTGRERPRKGIEILFGAVGKVPNEHEISVENIVTKLQKLESDIVELTPEQIIDYIRKEYPTVENFDAIKSWRTFSIPGTTGLTAVGTKLGMEGINIYTSEGRLAIRKLVYPEAEEIKNLSAAQIVEYIKNKYPTVKKFDEIDSDCWNKFNILGVGAIRVIGKKLGIQGVHMQTLAGKLAVRKLVYPEAEEIKELSAAEVIEYIKKQYPTAEKFDEMKMEGENGWKNFNIPGIGLVTAIGRKLGIEGVNMLASVGKLAVRKIVYPEAEDKAGSAAAIVEYIRKQYPTAEKFDEMKMQGENSWASFSIPGAGGIIAIGTKLGISGLAMKHSAGKFAVRRLVYPEVEEIKELSAMEVLEYIRSKYPTVGEFDNIKIGAGWNKFNIPGVGLVTAIGRKLGIEGINMYVIEGKLAIRKIVYPKAIEIEELTREQTIEYIKSKYPTVEKFDEIRMSGKNNWQRFKIPGVGGVTSIGTKLGIKGNNKMLILEGKLEVRKIVYPEAIEIKELTREQTIEYIRNMYPTIREFNEIKLKGENSWVKFNIPLVGGVTAIGTKLGIKGLNMAALEGKLALRKIIYGI